MKSTTDGETEYCGGGLGDEFSAIHLPEQIGGSESPGGIVQSGSYAPVGTAEQAGTRVFQFDFESAPK